MPRMVHFSARICGPDCGVIKGFLEEFLRRAGIRTILGLARTSWKCGVLWMVSRPEVLGVQPRFAT